MVGNREQIAQVVGGSALTIGAVHALAPVVSGRFWRLAPQSAPVVPHVIRAYGCSLVGLGLVTLNAGPDQDTMMRIASGVGAATALTGLLGGLRGRVDGLGAAMTIAAAGGLAALAAAAVRKG